MKNWFARLLRAWVCLSVFSAVGLSLAPTCWADSITIPTGPFCGDCEVTNLTFYSVAEVDEWIDALYDETRSVSNLVSYLSSGVSRIRSNALTISNLCDSITASASTIVASEDMAAASSILSDVNSIQNNLYGGWSPANTIIGRCDTMAAQLSSVDDAIRNIFIELSDTVPEYRAQFATMCEASGSSGGGSSSNCCCNCPDYTPFIDEIEYHLQTLNTSFSNVVSDVYVVRNLLHTLYQEFLTQRGYVIDIADYTYYIGTMILNALDASDLALGTNGGFDPESAGGTTGRFAGLTLYSQLVLNQGLTNIFERMALRDWFLWNDRLHPSPQYDDLGDWLAMTLKGVGGLVEPSDDAAAWPIVNSWRDFYYNRNVYPTNEIINPLWVAFTNQVRLSDDIINVSLSSYSGDSIAQLTAMLTNIVLNVVQVTNDINVTAETEVDVAVDILDEHMDETSDPEEETDTIRTNSVSFSEIGRVMRSTVTSYKSIFTTILQEEPPERIMITSGWHVGYGDVDFEIESIYWQPDGTESHWLTIIRKIFRAVWAAVFLVVIYAACGFDLFVVGVCTYMCYGILTGRSDVAVKGLKWCFDVLCRMLGFHAAK